MIKLIWAQTKSGVIGNDNKLPWSIKDEMEHFKQTTLNKSVLMGRKTFESMKSKLPNRVNYVLTSDTNAFIKNEANLFFINDMNELIEKFKSNKKEDLFVIGGAFVLKNTIDFADEIIRTTIKKEYSGNVKIDNFNLSNFDKIKVIENKDFFVEYFKRRLDV